MCLSMMGTTTTPTSNLFLSWLAINSNVCIIYLVVSSAYDFVSFLNLSISSITSIVSNTMLWYQSNVHTWDFGQNYKLGKNRAQLVLTLRVLNGTKWSWICIRQIWGVLIPIKRLSGHFRAYFTPLKLHLVLMTKREKMTRKLLSNPP